MTHKLLLPRAESAPESLSPRQNERTLPATARSPLSESRYPKRKFATKYHQNIQKPHTETKYRNQIPKQSQSSKKAPATYQHTNTPEIPPEIPCFLVIICRFYPSMVKNPKKRLHNSSFQILAVRETTRNHTFIRPETTSSGSLR